MDDLLRSCETFAQYPQNVIQNEVLSHTLKSYFDKLDEEEARLFNEKQAAVDFLDFDSSDKEFLPGCATSLIELKKILREGWRVERDPQCRFIFLHSPHSRAPLRVSRSMMSFLFTYHQVMPSFLDFIFPFGRQIEAQDFHFSGLRDESRLGTRQRGPEIPRLNRSGNEIRICYNLRSVERSESQPGLKWSIRQSAVYHSFDLETGQSLWINVKGNKMIKNRITESATSPSFLDDQKTREAAFSATFIIHQLICNWSCENWRWYLNDLENEFQLLAKNAPYLPIDRDSTPPPSPIFLGATPRTLTGSLSPVSRRGTAQTNLWGKTETFSHGVPSRTNTLISSIPNVAAAAPSQQNCYNHDSWFRSGFLDAGVLKKRLQSFFLRGKWNWFGHSYQHNSTSQSPIPIDEMNPPTPIASTWKMNPSEMPPNFSQDGDEKPQEVFTFTDLQRLQNIEDKLQEVLLVLSLNVEVLEELRQHYQFVTSHSAFPPTLKSHCEMDLAKFMKSVLSVEKELRMLQSRTETFLRVLEGKKNLLNGILHYRGVKANESFARKNQLSAERMEFMTLEMHAIAKKTEQETVSMRVITSVTLFFLPATFIATFMSTDILKFEDGKQDFQLRALHIYLAIALPLTAITFFVWWIFYRMAKKASLQADLEA